MSGYRPTSQPPDNRSGQRGSSGNALSPSSPAGQQPPSFKTDVNRKKTTRWVNAKSYAYDGDEWGSESEDENSDQGAAGGSAAPPSTGRPNPAVPEPASSSAAAAGHPGFIRPADIYKRMAEEQGREQQGQPGTSQPDPPAPSAPNVEKSDEKAAETPTDKSRFAGLPQLKRLSSDFGSDFMGGESSPLDRPQKDSTPTDKPSDSTPTAEGGLQHNPSAGFRSAVNQAFDDDAESLARSNSESTTHISPIIRSGTMPTPHDPRLTEKGTTPTIEEEPSGRRESAAAAADYTPGYRRSLTPPSRDNSPARRPVVVPSRQPTTQSDFADVSDEESPLNKHPGPEPLSTSDKAALSQVTSNTATGARDEPNPHSSSDPAPGSSAGRDVASPPTEARGGGELQPSQSVPAHQPDISSDQTTSQPQRGESSLDADNNSRTKPGAVNDMLHDQIVRSLAVNPSAARDSPEYRGDDGPAVVVPPVSDQESAPKPGGYDSSWNSHAGGISDETNPVSSQVPPASEGTAVPDSTSSPLAQVPHNKLAALQDVDEPSSSAPAKPKLKKRFSWEQSSDEEETEKPQPVGQSQPAPLSAGNEPIAREQEHVPATTIESVRADHTLPDSQGKTSTDSSAEHKELRSVSPVGSAPAPRYQTEDRRQGEPDTTSVPPDSGADVIVVPGNAQPSAQQIKLADFREIMSMTVHAKKLGAFGSATHQAVNTDTGLESWIQDLAASSPEHAAVIALNGQVPADADLSQRATSRPKFPKISSLGTLSLPSQHQDGGHRSGHARQASGAGLSGQQVQAKGKDLLHSAGVLGGKAGGAAKGLFAKGRSKFRNGGSGDKVYSNSPSSGHSLSRSTTTTGLTVASRGSTARPRAHTPQYQSLHNRPLPPLPSARNSYVSQSSGLATQPTVNASDRGRSLSLTSIQTRPQPWTGEENSEDPQSAPRIPHPLAADIRSLSPVSTLGISSDLWRPGYGDDTYLFRAGSVSTIGEYGDTPIDPKPQPDPDEPHIGDERPVSPAEPVNASATEEEPSDEAEGRPSEDIPGPEPPPKDGDTPRSVSPPGSRHSDSAAVVSPGDEQPVTCRKLQTTFPATDSNNKGTSEPPSDAETPILSATSNASVEFPRSSNAQQQSMHIMEASQYRQIVDQNKDRTTAKSTEMPKTSSSVRPQDKPMPPVPESPEHRLFEQRAATSTSADVSQPSQSSMPPATAHRGREAADSHNRASHVPRTSLSSFPQPPRQTQSAPTSAVRSQNPSPFRPRQPHPRSGYERPSGSGDVQHSASHSVSGSGLSGLLSKIQSGRRGSSSGPSTAHSESKEANKPEARGSEAQSSHSAPFHFSKPPRAGTFPVQESTRSVIPKALRRSSREERTADSKMASLGKLNTLLGRSSHQPSHSAVEPRLATHHEISRQTSLQNHPQSYADTQFESSQPTHVRGQRYYQAYNSAPAPNDYSNRSDDRTVEYYGPGAVESIESFSGAKTSDGGYDYNTHLSQSSAPTTYPSAPPHVPSFTPVPSTHVSTSTGPVQANDTLPPETRGRDWPANPQDKSYTAHLHLRSRSPTEKAHPDANSQENAVESKADPAADLGTFHTTSPKVDRVGDQATPWNLTMPRDHAKEQEGKDKPENSTASPINPSRYPLPGSATMSPINPTAVDMAPPSPPKSPPNEQQNKTAAPTAATEVPSTQAVPTTREAHPEQGTTITPPAEDSPKDPQPRPPLHEADPMEPVELPVPGDDSSEEVVMSSTAYPGQEWQPSFVGSWD